MQEETSDNQKEDNVTGVEEVKQESVDADESDSNKLEDIIDTSLTVKSEVTGDEDEDDDDEKQDMEKDVEESDAEVLQNDGDIKLEDLEEPNGIEENKEVIV